MPEHPSDDWLTTTPQRSGLDDNPLSVLRRHVVFEAADLAFLVVHQPADAILWRVPIDKWSVLFRHDATLTCLENSKSLFLAVTSADIHPSRLASFAICGCHLVIDRRNTSGTECVDVTKGTLLMTRSFGNFLLSYCCWWY